MNVLAVNVLHVGKDRRSRKEGDGDGEFEDRSAWSLAAEHLIFQKVGLWPTRTQLAQKCRCQSTVCLIRCLQLAIPLIGVL